MSLLSSLMRRTCHQGRCLLFFTLLLSFSLQASAQDTGSIPFNGQILDINREPMRKVRVWVNNEQAMAVQTDRNGMFGLLNVQSGDTLKLYLKKRLFTVPVSGKRAIRIHFWSDLSGLSTEGADDLQDLGYGLVGSSKRTASSDHITGEELVKTGIPDLLDALQGRIPGLVIQPSVMGQNASARIRGLTSITSSNEPLFIQDGIIVPTLTGINVHQVDYVEVLKDASIYGARGANGAIIVHTKGAN